MPRTRSAAAIGPRESASKKSSRLDLFRFTPFRLNRLAAEVSMALSGEYQERYGLDIPEWRGLAALGFPNQACSAPNISPFTPTHKTHHHPAVPTPTHRQS